MRLIAAPALALAYRLQHHANRHPSFPAPPPESPEICTIPAEGLREGFNTTYTAQLRSKGFTPANCRPVARLPAVRFDHLHWQMELGHGAVHEALPTVRGAFENGRQVGQALYDSTSGGARMGKFTRRKNKSMR